MNTKKILIDNDSNVVDLFKIGDDGIVYGYIGDPSIGIQTTSLNEESCSSIGFYYYNEECRWDSIDRLSNDVKLTFNDFGGPINFLKDDIGCSYEIDFEYILTYEYNGGIVKRVEIGKQFDQMESNLCFFNADTDEVLVRIPMFMGFRGGVISTDRIGDIPGLTHLNDIHASIYVFGDHVAMANELANYYGVSFPANRLRPGWKRRNFELTPRMLNLLVGKNVVMGVECKNYFSKDITIRLDEIKLYYDCPGSNRRVIYHTKNPSFNLEKTIDNKKSWVFKEGVDDIEDREYDVINRDTKYFTKTDKLVLNTKEIDLEFSPSGVSERLIFDIFKESPEELSYLTDWFGRSKTQIPHISEFDDLENYDTFQEFIDVVFNLAVSPRTTHTSREYYLLRGLYFHYLNNFNEGQINFKNTMSLIKKIDEYWLKIIEQLIPSTSIWGSSLKISNSILNSNKFPYRKYSYTPEDHVQYNILDYTPDSLVDMHETTIHYGNTTISNSEKYGINSYSTGGIGEGQIYFLPIIDYEEEI